MTPSVNDACTHIERVEGVCTRCGDCEHDVVLNGACMQCGSQDLAALAMQPKKSATISARDLMRKVRALP